MVTPAQESKMQEISKNSFIHSALAQHAMESHNPAADSVNKNFSLLTNRALELTVTQITVKICFIIGTRLPFIRQKGSKYLPLLSTENTSQLFQHYQSNLSHSLCILQLGTVQLGLILHFELVRRNAASAACPKGEYLFHKFWSLLINMERSLIKVELQADVYMLCLQHALSTENFEVMGLLIGDLEDGVAKISAVIILRRLDKKKDRVEISPEQLLEATVEAERLQDELKRSMRILGWYHSHPHITVFPSHVDVGTQATYQMMDPGFVGLIFSVFSESKDTKEQEIVLTCFQSRNNKTVEVPLEIVKTQGIASTCLNTMKELPEILVQEEEEVAKPCEKNPDVLAVIHNDAVRTRALVHIADIITKPLIEMFEQRIKLNTMRNIFLQDQLMKLEMELLKCQKNQRFANSSKVTV
ncbi:hypothetical protein PV328_007761 [Microctonus aethiopoides]|uniref:MPN domain-containing protein n=1 Tax=Microctonus aethiopoides TaxID=144406 RepID=A0AA39C9M7_9HYME|nr:hypothetical protein PV328_007761 [Microctonus aethiopoides]